MANVEKHQVLLLVDKEEDERNSAVVVYVPTSHVLLHEVTVQYLPMYGVNRFKQIQDHFQADLLSIQLLHDSNERIGDVDGYSAEVRSPC